MPKVVGETAVGEPIYEVQSVRLMLRSGAAHFDRIVACAKCGSDVPGPPVLNAVDLEHPANPILCGQCVKISAAVGPIRLAAPDAGEPETPSPDTAVAAGDERKSVDESRLAALERRTEELARAHEDALEQLHATFATEGMRVGAAVDRVVEGHSEVREAQVETGRRLDDLTDRLGKIEETTSGPPHALGARLEALEQRLEETVERLTERDEVQAELRVVLEGRVDQLATVLQALEERVQRSDDEMSGLGDLHAGLDVGLGALRSEIAEVRDAVKKVAGQQADVQDRLEDLDRAQRTAAPADSGRSRRPGRRADAGANLAIAIEAAEILAREHQQLKAQVAGLEKAAEAAAATAARASSLATASGPLRSDVRLLQEQLAAQNEAIATLGRTVERLRRKVSTPAAVEPPSKPPSKPATKPARKATKR